MIFRHGLISLATRICRENGASTLPDAVERVAYRAGHIIVAMESGVKLRFPTAGNLRLARGTSRQLNNIEVSPFGLHWPDLDEDLSFRGLLEGDYGQRSPGRTKGPRGRMNARR